MSENSKIVWVDYLRVIATFCVVFLHSAATLVYKYNELPEEYWWVGNIYDSMVRMCVPIFFMISGHLLLEKQESLSLFFRKRVNKVFVPLLVWSIIFVFWNTFYERNSDISFYSFYSIFLTPNYYHLWYLYAIVGVYLFLPILRQIINKSDSSLVVYYLFIWFGAVSVIPVAEKITSIDSRIDLLSISGYTGFLVLGYFLGKIEATRSRAVIASVIFIISIFVTAVGTYYLTISNNGTLDEYFYGYLSPNVIMMSASFFVVAKYLFSHVKIFSNQKAVAVLTSLSSASLGIYLIHTMYLYVLKNGDFGFVLSGLVGHPLISVPVTAVVTFFLSYLTIFFIRLMPVIRKISP